MVEFIESKRTEKFQNWIGKIKEDKEHDCSISIIVDS